MGVCLLFAGVHEDVCKVFAGVYEEVCVAVAC